MIDIVCNDNCTAKDEFNQRKPSLSGVEMPLMLSTVHADRVNCNRFHSAVTMRCGSTCVKNQ